MLSFSAKYTKYELNINPKNPMYRVVISSCKEEQSLRPFRHEEIYLREEDIGSARALVHHYIDSGEVRKEILSLPVHVIDLFMIF